MTEHLFLCGLSDEQRAEFKDGTVLQIHEGRAQNINLNIDNIRAWYVFDEPELLTDYLEIAAYVFAADNSTSRGGSKFQNMGQDWRRSFHLVIAVRRPDRWSAPDIIHAIGETLGFLTDDSWVLKFVPCEDPPKLQSYLNFSDRTADNDGASNIVLFSGGLDSLAGALHELENTNSHVVLVSHRSANIMTNRQNVLAEELLRRYPKRVFHVPVRIQMKNGLCAVEYTQRTRSFLFTAIAAVVAILEGTDQITFYENGIMSVNLPISVQVVGTRATRTTHPHSLRLLEKFLNLIVDSKPEITNPFFWKTKAKVVAALRNAGGADLIRRTVSCTRVREINVMHSHCGTCAQCLQRRIGTLACGAGDEDPKLMYEVDLLEGPREDSESRLMTAEIVRSALEFRRLIDQGFLSRYAGEISRVVKEFPDLSADQVALQLFDLLRRYGQEVYDVLTEGVKNRSESLVDKTLPETCLLRTVVASPELRLSDDMIDSAPLDLWSEEDNGGIEPQVSPHIVLAIDIKNRCILFDDIAPIKGPTIFPIMELLGARYLEDQASNIHPKKFRLTKPMDLVDELGLTDEQAARAAITRFRRQVKEEYQELYALSLDINAIIENVHGAGYRINTDVRIVDVDEIGSNG